MDIADVRDRCHRDKTAFQAGAHRQQPLIAGQIARWPAARDLHNIEMRLDYRQSPLRLELRYAAIQLLPPADFLDEL